MLPDRRARHETVSAWLDARDDDELLAVLDAAPDAVSVGGGSSVLDVAGGRVFVKRIAITDRELAHPRSTANLFDVPLACQYGMYPLAGPGFSAWRELAANETVTRAVLDDRTEAFALLHHWRVLPGRPPAADEHRDVEAVVAQFGGAPGVRTRFEELARATRSLVMFTEHVPHALADRLDGPLGEPATLERHLFGIVDALRDLDLLHLDAHLGNLRADDERAYLVDFGLATSSAFELSDEERAFVVANRDHDADYASMRLVNWLVTTVCGVPLPDSGGPVERNAYVRRCADGDIPADVPPEVADILARHAPAAARMNDFCWRLVDGDLTARYGPADGPTR
ncbi:serine/threonine protein phosphatase [Cellulomonas palmilytica]|uniref:serine/threonine protein phosphatase n=1 Tax=Cellulomonas palmilytica TaxID=2608402 RepID=UPI001F228EF8|nr:serine/threonine protein phosphatase [Cellulomonas palmilytica]UJP40312.1 serine/threonine protein phosphatase [Cellulomonas palmilytica]